jgi:eukaryotic-like serine/threonine-protein kinase
MTTPKPDEAAIFNLARRIETPEARRLYVEQTCRDDPQLLARVQALLRVHEDTAFLESPPPGLRSAAEDKIREGPGTRIGHYKLIEQIGQGGFGVVFLAEQQQPVRRKVAVKILKPGMDSAQVVARFEAERQALALMDHPYIARVLDGGETTSGRPYFVMELVKGVSITRYCNEHQLTLRERLVLFVQICQAVQHAHQKGIIHRDLKPSNILVAAYDGHSMAKVIDFGVAKALGGQLTERTLVTGFTGVLGTLEYMSPEQAEFNARDIDTRSDIYSLGVILYELLTGTTPLTKEKLQEAGVTEVLRLIREVEPPRPSARLSALKATLAPISAQRRLQPAQLAREVRGDLDWIVMKCLEKDRSRRYETANGLARDLERYLSDEQVEARPPSAVYRLRKFARKNRRLLASATAFALLRVAGIILTTWQAVRATLAERVAGQERDRAEAEADLAGRQLYAAHMNLAQIAWDEARVGRVAELLDQYQPRAGARDLRGFEWYYWQRLLDTALATLEGHTDRIWSVAFSPNGRRLASASEDKTIRLWDVAREREPLILHHQERVFGVAFSPDGKSLASAGEDGRVITWDTASGQMVVTLAGHRGWVWSVAFSPDGKWLASGGQDGMVVIWDLASKRPSWSLKGHHGIVRSVAFSPDGKRLASAGDSMIRLWDAASGRQTGTLSAHTWDVYSLAFSPDGKRLASASWDRTVRVWEVASGRQLLFLYGHADRVFAVAFSPDGKRLASAGFDRRIKIWDASNGRLLFILRGHTGWIGSVAFSPDGLRLASAGLEGTVKLWDPISDWENLTLNGHRDVIESVAFSPDGKQLASAANDRTIRLWDPASGLPLPLLFEGHTNEVWSIAFSSDGKRLVSASTDQTVRVWDAETGQQLLKLDGPGGRVWSAAFSPDGGRVAAGGEDQGVCVWEAASGRKLLTLRLHTGGVRGVAFSPDGKRLASGGADKLVKVWDAATGQELLSLKGHTDQVNSVAFSPDGKRLASASSDRTVRLWDTASGELSLELIGHSEAVVCIAFSPDGKRLASAGDYQTIKLWDVVSGQETASLKGHTHSVTSVAFSPDGRRLASGSIDQTVRVWDARPWTPRLRLEQDARSLLTSLSDGVPSWAGVIRRINQATSSPAAVRRQAFDMLSRRLGK